MLYGLLIGTGQFSALFIAMGQGVTVGLASLVIQAQVFFTILLARLFHAERPRPAQIAGAGLTMRNWSLALQGFREAVALDPQLVDGWSMIVQILAALNRPDEARAALAEALAANPGNPALAQLAAQLGVR